MAANAAVKRKPVTGGGNPWRGAYVIAFGNEKGGTGKTTTAVHIAVLLLKAGHKVSVIDLDSRQKTFARYMENRAAYAARKKHELPMPKVRVIERSRSALFAEASAEEGSNFERALNEARAEADYVIIDTPGNDTLLSRLGHAAADTLVTPMNDSFLDFDLLARVDPETLEVEGPSLYSEFVWECRKRRVLSRRPAIDWVVIRNRVSALKARNKRRVAAALKTLSTRIGFREARGITERVIFRELFPLGLTVFDLPLSGVPVAFSMSHVSARQEIRALLATLRLPGLERIAASA